jgi:hypothetical protein
MHPLHVMVSPNSSRSGRFRMSGRTTESLRVVGPSASNSILQPVSSSHEWTEARFMVPPALTVPRRMVPPNASRARKPPQERTEHGTCESTIMRTAVGCVLAVSLVAGCATPQPVAVNAAAHSLACPPEDVDAYALESNQWDVRGCGRRATLECTGSECVTLGAVTNTLIRLRGSPPDLREGHVGRPVPAWAQATLTNPPPTTFHGGSVWWIQRMFFRGLR